MNYINIKTYSLLLVALLSLWTKSLSAKLCICTFPDTQSNFGRGYEGEVEFYKAGCALWLVGKLCSNNLIKNINTPLENLIEERILTGKKIQDILVGYVGHWADSFETIRYLDKEVKPVVDRFGISVELDNTGCSSLDNPSRVQTHIMEYNLSSSVHIQVRGNQVTSIGVWDKVDEDLKTINFFAVADSRFNSPIYPYCDQFLNRPCSRFHQEDEEEGLCQSSTGLKTLVCKSKKNKKRSFRWSLKES